MPSADSSSAETENCSCKLLIASQRLKSYKHAHDGSMLTCLGHREVLASIAPHCARSLLCDEGAPGGEMKRIRSRGVERSHHSISLFACVSADEATLALGDAYALCRPKTMRGSVGCRISGSGAIQPFQKLPATMTSPRQPAQTVPRS